MIVATALLAGCAIGPDYKRPAVAEPPTFRGQETAEAVSFADAPWWEVFQDPILQALIQEALQRNYDVAIAAARVQEARANVGVARSDYFPSLDYNVGAGRSKVGPGILGAPGGPVPNATNFYSASTIMSWELDVWGRIRRSNESARAALLATEDARRAVWLTLSATWSLLQLLALDVRFQIAHSTSAYQRTYDLFLDRLNLGVAPNSRRVPGCARRCAGQHSTDRATSSPRKTRSASCSAKHGPIVVS
jgi:multidrug efflux system outer membrane protein